MCQKALMNYGFTVVKSLCEGNVINLFDSQDDQVSPAAFVTSKSTASKEHVSLVLYFHNTKPALRSVQ